MSEQSSADARAVACDFDDEVIELHALGRIEDSELREHFDTCENCRARVTEYRFYIKVLQKALREL